VCRQNGIVLVMFSGDTTEDLNLLQKSTASVEQCRSIWRYLREGGVPMPARCSAILWQFCKGRSGAGAAPAAVRSGVPPAHDAATAAHWLEPGLGSGRPARPW
jgi:cobaltochelatase CobN